MTYIEPIFDRTLADVEEARENPTSITKGAYNYVDLNRIENNTRYVADDMYARGITPEPITLNSKYNWNELDVPTLEDMSRIINNILLLQALSVENLELETIYATGQMTYTMANAIEKNLEIMRTQQLPAPNEYYLEVVNGTGSGSYTEDTVVTITADLPPENKIFDKWSGSPDDLKQVANVHAATTTFTMWHKNATITANYKSGLKHTLKISPTGISGDGEYYEGDTVTIIAAEAVNGKVFHHWEGEYVDNLVNQKASTTLFTMPDEDVLLTAVYINPGKHYLTVNDGSGSGWYDYEDYAFASATLPSSKHTFSHWSGDTSYIEDASSSNVSVKMKDTNVTLTAHFIYHPGKCKLTVVNGSGSGEYTEGNSVRIIANDAPEGKGFLNWSKVGVGSISDANSSSTYYYAGDGEATITANYEDVHTITLANINNSGNSSSGNYVKSKRYYFYTQEVVGNMIFDHWEENGKQYSTSTGFYLTIGDEDRTFTAVYRNKNTHTLTVTNGSGSGEYQEKQQVRITANAAETGYAFDGWRGSGASINDSSYQTATITMGNSDASYTATYKALHTLTVVNGSGSGTYKEGHSIRIVANSAPTGKRFKQWTGDTSTISSVNAASTYISIGTSDITITAEYEDLPDWNLTVTKGKGSGTYKSGTTVQIVANEAPDDMTFLTWVGDVSQVENVWASTTRILGISANTTVEATYYTPEHPEEYLLTVINGSFSSTYPAGSEVKIYADEPLEGYEFWKWTGDTSTIRDIKSANTSMVMPAAPTTITANYKKEGSIDLYTLTVNYGTGSGDYEEGTEVDIEANPAPNGSVFNKWLGDTANVMNVTESKTKIVIGKDDVVITASYTPLEKHELSVVGGFGSGSYWFGQKVQITANKENNDDTKFEFVEWTGDIDTLDSITNKVANLTMPDNDATITAKYNEYWHLIIGNGSTSDYYLSGSKVKIHANAAPEGMKFSKWTGDTSILSSIYNPDATLIMPQSVVHVTAAYTTIGKDNSVAYYNDVLSNKEVVITSNDLKIISDKLELGTLITDKNGNVGVITEQTENKYTVKRLFTTIVKEEE